MNKNGGIRLPRTADGSLDLGKLSELGKQERVHENSSVMNQLDQAMELIRTVKVRLGPSKVHGVGVFAIRDIKKGEQVYCQPTVRPQWYTVSLSNLSKHLDATYPQIKQLILDRWPQVVNGAPFLSPNYDQRLLSFMNHSDKPNYDPLTDCALSDIKAGKELFEDYKVVENYEKAFPWLSTQQDLTKGDTLR